MLCYTPYRFDRPLTCAIWISGDAINWLIVDCGFGKSISSRGSETRLDVCVVHHTCAGRDRTIETKSSAAIRTYR